MNPPIIAIKTIKIAAIPSIVRSKLSSFMELISPMCFPLYLDHPYLMMLSYSKPEHIEVEVIMETIKLQSRVSKDGILRLEVPVNASDTEIEVVLVVQPMKE